MQSLTKELDFALRTATQAGQAALRYFRHDTPVETKPDASPVTAADRDCERFIAAAVAEAFPRDGILGEEGAHKPTESGRRWVIDPIDGTREFIRGNPAWANFIALEEDSQVLVGVAHFPALEQTFYASLGGGAFCNQAPIRVSAIDTPAQAVLSVNGLNDLRRYPFAPHLLEWMEGFWAVRSMGGCLDAMMLARGQADLWLESSGKPWDFAAVKVIAEEAGARFFDFQGRNTIYGGNLVLAAPGLEAEARRLLAMR